VEAGTIAAWRWDPSEKAFSWSEGMHELFGVTPDEFGGVGSALEGFAHPEDRTMVSEQLVEIREGAKPRPLECRLVRADGAVRWVRVEGDAFTDEVGKAVVVGIVRDITERKRAEQALQESEEKWHSMVENAHDYIFLIDRDLKLQYVNRTAPGLTPDDVIGTSVLDYVSPVSREDAREAFRRVFETGRGEAHWHRGAGRSGELAWYSVRLGPVRIGGRIESVAAVVTDITERKRAEQALQESEEKWHSLVENAQDFIFLVDRDLKLQYVNRTAPGLTPDQVIGTSILNYISPEYQDEARRAVELVFETGGTETYEHSGPRPEGELAWYSVRMGPVKLGERVVSVAAVATDITQRKRAEETILARDEVNRTLLDAIPDMMFRLGRDGTYLDFIPAKGQKPFVPPTEFVGRTVDHVLPPAPAREIMECVRTTLATDEAQACEYELTEDGKSHHYEARVVATGTDEVLLLARDVTQRKLVEQELGEADARYQALLDKHTNGVALVVDREVRYTNARFQELLGYSAEELEGRLAGDLVVPEDRPRLAQRMKALAEGSPEYPSRYRAVRKDGQQVPIEVHTRMVPYQGKLASLATIRDVSQRQDESTWDDVVTPLQNALSALEAAAPHIAFDSPVDHHVVSAVGSLIKAMRAAASQT
jgi:PAS domain S-box-containing protein